jgi:thiamine-phosphate pyrophosphorylase
VNVESYRTRAAKLARAAAALKRWSERRPPFSLAFMTDASRAPHPELVLRVLPPGAAVILRDYDAPNREALARKLLSICRTKRLLLLVGADVRLARSVGADGVHLPSWARNNIVDGMIVSAACHNEGELDRAVDCGADIALLSPVLPTASHPGAPALGPEKFRMLAARAPVPVLPLGGVDETQALKLTGPGVSGLAAISAFLPRKPPAF